MFELLCVTAPGLQFVHWAQSCDYIAWVELSTLTQRAQHLEGVLASVAAIACVGEENARLMSLARLESLLIKSLRPGSFFCETTPRSKAPGIIAQRFAIVKGYLAAGAPAIYD